MFKSLICRQLGRLSVCLTLSFCVPGAFAAVTDLPQSPLYLWAEKPLVSPDREVFKYQRVYYVDNPSMKPFWPIMPLLTAPQ